MNKVAFEELLDSVREAGRIQRGETQPSRQFVRDSRDVRHVREKLGISQGTFARLIGVSVNTVQNWEQGRRIPTGPARVVDERLVEAMPYARRRLKSSAMPARASAPVAGSGNSLRWGT